MIEPQVRIITNAGFSRSGLEKLLKAADKKKLDAALEKPIGGVPTRHVAFAVAIGR